MKTGHIRGLHNLTEKHRGAVLTIGNFDGVHLGHQALLARVKERAAALQVPSIVMTFEPQPFEFFAKDKSAPRLTRWREKFCWLQEYGVDYVLVVRFDADFAALRADAFVKSILLEKLAIKALIVGDDFHCGYAREGDIPFLRAASEKYHFEFEAMPTIAFQNERVSSSRVRNALLSGDLSLAEKLLGRPYTMKGRVVHGEKRGRILGFPTANIYLHRRETPVHGIFIVRMHGLSASGLPGVANVGTRPTFDGTRTLLEVHIFNFNQDIYRRYVQVEFCKKLRDEKRYDNFDLLQQQIILDANAAKKYFKVRGEL